jgi:hypothetical protein
MTTTSDGILARVGDIPEHQAERVYEEYGPFERGLTVGVTVAMILATLIATAADPAYGFFMALFGIVIVVGLAVPLRRRKLALVTNEEGIGLRKGKNWVRFVPWSDFGGWRDATGWRKFAYSDFIEILRKDGSIAFYTRATAIKAEPIRFAYLCRELERRLPPRGLGWEAQDRRPWWLPEWVTEKFCNRALLLSAGVLVLSIFGLLLSQDARYGVVVFLLLLCAAALAAILLTSAWLSELLKLQAARDAASHRRLPDPVHEALLDFVDRPAGQLRSGFVYRYAPRVVLVDQFQSRGRRRRLFPLYVLVACLFALPALSVFGLLSVFASGLLLIFLFMSIALAAGRERHWRMAIDDEIEVRESGFVVRRGSAVQAYKEVSKKGSGKMSSPNFGDYAFKLKRKGASYQFDPRFLEQCEELAE